jgi:hypothetical protein
MFAANYNTFKKIQYHVKSYASITKFSSPAHKVTAPYCPWQMLSQFAKERKIRRRLFGGFRRQDCLVRREHQGEEPPCARAPVQKRPARLP